MLTITLTILTAICFFSVKANIEKDFKIGYYEQKMDDLGEKDTVRNMGFLEMIRSK